MDGWDAALLVGAGYLAVTILVRLMLARRNRVLADYSTQIEAAQNRKKAEREKEAKAREARTDAA